MKENFTNSYDSGDFQGLSILFPLNNEIKFITLAAQIAPWYK